MALTLQAAAATPAPDWHLAATPNFKILTDGSELDAKCRGQYMELARAVLQTVSPDLRGTRQGANRSCPSFVYLFSSEKQFQEYSGDAGLDGYFVPRPDGNYLAVNAESVFSYETATHEYVHQYLMTTCPAVPVWFNEGLATYFQTLLAEGQVVRLGTPPKYYADTILRFGLMPLRQVLAANYESKEYRDEDLRQRFYTTSWFFVSYLLAGGEELRAQLSAYLDLLRSGTASADAFQKAFKKSAEELDKDLHAYLKKAKASKNMPLCTIRFKSLGIPPGWSFSTLSPAQAQARLGLLGLWGRKNTTERSRAQLQAALAQEPTCASAELGLGLLALNAADITEALSRFRKACLADQGDAVAHYMAGLVMMERFSSGAADLRNETRDHLARAIQLGYPMPLALQLLKALLLDPRYSDAGDVPTLESVSRALPLDLEFKRALIEAYLQAQKHTQARSVLLEIKNQNRDPSLAQWADTIVTQLDKVMAYEKAAAAN